MAQFDDLVAKYRNLTYGRLTGGNTSAVNSLLNAQDRGTNSISSPNYFGNIPADQQQYVETPTGFIGQNRYEIDPNTGIPVLQTPTVEGINQGIEMGGGTAGYSGGYDSSIDYGDTGYAGVVPEDPDTGLIGQVINNVRQGGSEAQDRNQNERLSKMQDRYTRNDDGTISQYDASSGKTKIYGLDDKGLTLAQKFFGNVTNVPTTGGLLEDAIDGIKNYFNPNKGPIGGNVTAQDFNVATGGNKPVDLNVGYTPSADLKTEKELSLPDNLTLNRTNNPLSLPAGRFKGNDRPNRGVRSEGVAGGGNKDKGSAGGSVNTGGGGFGGRW